MVPFYGSSSSSTATNKAESSLRRHCNWIPFLVRSIHPSPSFRYLLCSSPLLIVILFFRILISVRSTKFLLLLLLLLLLLRTIQFCLTLFFRLSLICLTFRKLLFFFLFFFLFFEKAIVMVSKSGGPMQQQVSILSFNSSRETSLLDRFF